MVKQGRRFLGSCPVAGAFLLIVVLTTIYFTGNDFFRSQMRYIFSNTLPIQPIAEDEKLILFWTTFFDSADYYFGLGRAPFQTANCTVQRCQTTTDKSLLSRSHAVVFHLRDIRLRNLPSQRLSDQRWIFYLLESPENTPTDILNSLPEFNWTMTYRQDSDIHLPYGRIRGRPTNLGNWTDVNHVISHKKKNIAWFVSHCPTSSKREEFVGELSKFTQVDIYGSCGPLQCTDRRRCNTMLRDNYRFYLAFENSICRDYVTEKFFAALEYYVVPVVYGGANYSAIAPPHSYINALDFASPKELAAYLNYLSKNRTAYTEYFRWRKHFRVSYTFEPWCNLCQMLHDASAPSKSYFNIHKWWVEDAHCVKPSTVFS